MCNWGILGGASGSVLHFFGFVLAKKVRTDPDALPEWTRIFTEKAQEGRDGKT